MNDRVDKMGHRNQAAPDRWTAFTARQQRIHRLQASVDLRIQALSDEINRLKVELV